MSIVSMSLDVAPDAAVLARPVLDENGNMLVAAGAPLTAGLKSSLLRRGVMEVAVVEANANASAAADSRDAVLARQATEARLLHLFRHVLRSGQVSPLFQIVSRYRTEGST